MKKTLFFLLALMMPLMASADEVIDGIKYDCYTVGNVNYAQVKGYETGLTIANIPGSVTSGGKQYTVTSIGQSAFSGCSTLTSVTFPNSMVAISNYAFSGCTSLTSITIPSGMTESIGYGVFQGCTSLSSIVVNSGNTKYNSGDNCNAIIETSTKKLIAGCQNTTIPSTVTKIGQLAFSALNNLTSINIPSSVKTIEASAFQTTGLTSVNLSNVTSIGDYAFNSCTGLTSVTTKASIGSYAFQGCTGLTSVTMTSGTTIGNNAFDGCYSLTSVTMPNTLTSIGDFAFSGTSVKIVTIPSSVTSIGNYAFVPSGGLTSVTVERTYPCTLTSNPFPSSWQATLYVPKGSKASYEAANYWKDFGTIKLSGLIEQTLALTSIPTKTYGDAAFSLPATTEEGLTLTWSVANTNVATVSSNVFTIKGAGTTTVTATQAGNDDYEAFSREFTLTVNKAQLTIIANDQSMTYGNLITSLGVKYYGFKYGEEPYGTLTTLPTIACSATNTSNVGTYSIVVSGAKAANYNITHINGTLTINKAPLTITAKSYTINQKDDLPEFEVTYDGFKNSQTSSVLTTLPTITCDATDSETAGDFDITPSGAAATNYSFNYVSGTLTVNAVESVTIAMKTGGGVARSMIAYSSKYALDFTSRPELKAYIACGYNDKKEVLLVHVKVVPPYTGMVIKTSNGIYDGGEYDVPTTTEEYYYANLLVPVVETGTVTPTETIADVEYTNLTIGTLVGGGIGFVRLTSNWTTHNKSYLRIPTALYNSLASARGFGDIGVEFVEGEEATGILNAKRNALENNGNYYDLLGRKVKPIGKGLYIHNGKKVLVK